MPDRLDIALAQINPLVGDIEGNVRRIRASRDSAAAAGADLVVFSELVIEGYTPEDMILKPAFQADVRAALAELAADTADGGPAMIVGAGWPEDGTLYNAALLLADGRITGRSLKYELPNYGVFDEKRIFTAGPLPLPVDFRGVKLGLMVCEDMWVPEPAEHLADSGAEILIVVNGSPYEIEKRDTRLMHAHGRVKETGKPLVFVNQIGGQDETVFDGASFVLTAAGELDAQLPAWEADLAVTRWEKGPDGWDCAAGDLHAYPDSMESIYRALTVGLHDYVDKNRFPGVVIGLSGGIDSALSAVVAVDALGADRVHCIMMPSQFTSTESLEDAAECARLLGVRYDTVPINAAITAFGTMLDPLFKGLARDTTEENIQARTRGVILMAASNKFGSMVVATGNKSEMSVGYATLYGDMCGGYSVLKDVYKTTVYRLAAWRNHHWPNGVLGPDGLVIPHRILEKAPSAELKDDQTDQDSLPPYEHLDDILHCLIEMEMGFDAIVARGHEPDTVRKVEHMLYIAEYKRRQAPPGVKITSRHFGRDRRYPITNGFRDAR